MATMGMGGGSQEQRGMGKQFGRTALGLRGFAALKGQIPQEVRRLQVGAAQAESSGSGRSRSLGGGVTKGLASGGLRGRGNPTLKRFRRSSY